MTYEQGSEIRPLASYVEQFIQERKYLKGVSAATLEWYKYSFKAFAPVLSVPHQSSTEIKAAVIARIGELQGQGRGNKNVSVNTYLRCLKTFLLWCHTEQILKEPVKLSWLREENNILQTLSTDHIRAIINFRATGINSRRVHTLACLALDTGMRVAELLSLRWTQVNFDSLAIVVNGKGGKQRIIPFSAECRKILYKWKQQQQGELVFSTRTNYPLPGTLRSRL